MKLVQQNNEIVTMGNVSLLKNNAKILISATTAANYDVFKFNMSNYQVPTGKILRIWAFRVSSNAAAANALSRIGYGDTAVLDAAGAPTNYVIKLPWSVITTSVNSLTEGQMYVEIPAGKYPHVYNSSVISTINTFLCEEVSV